MDNKNIHILYTLEASKAFEALIIDTKKRIEDSLIKEKYVTGDSEIEITVADIERIKNRIIIRSDYKSNFKKEKIYFLFGYAYFIIGIISFLIAFFWDDFMYMLSRNEPIGLVGLSGIVMALFGLILVFVIYLNRSRYKSETEELGNHIKYYNEIANLKQLEKILEMYELMSKEKEKETKESKDSVKFEMK